MAKLATLSVLANKQFNTCGVAHSILTAAYLSGAASLNPNSYYTFLG